MDAIIGVSGPPLAGKNSVAERLVEKHGFVHIAFSDALYAEVAAAFGVTDKFLRNPKTKHEPSETLGLQNCADRDFVRRMVFAGHVTELAWFAMSPRVILQLWGTEHRRAQDVNYWVDKTREHIFELARETFAPLRVVIDGVRFGNEEALIRNWPGARVRSVWHVRRPGKDFSDAHEADAGRVMFDDKTDVTVYNHGSLEQLHREVDAICASTLV